jgi:hypothetical protein
MIFVDLSEGLGNQMFQYAFACALQEKYHDKIFLDTMSYIRNKGIRSFSLNNYRLNDMVDYNLTVKTKAVDICSKIFRKYLRLKNINLSDTNVVKKYEKSGFYICSNIFDYVDYEYLCDKKNKIVMGSWMNAKYFSDIRLKLLHDFSLKKELSKKNLEKAEEIEQVNAVCIHIRLGDYLTPKWSELNVCTEKYYKNAMDIIKQSVENPVFYIFSNTEKDIQWIAQNYTFSSECNFVNLHNSDYEDLELMRRCKHFIISNSTYSWWAQYLSLNENKIVVAPDKWVHRNGQYYGYKKNGETLGIYQNNWKIAEVE